MKFIELSHYLKHGTVSYPGMPPVDISTFMERKENSNDTGYLDFLKMVNISGTYIDAPYHAFENLDKIGDIPLEKLVDLNAFVVRINKKKGFFCIDDFRFLENENLMGSAVLLNSGFDKKYGTAEYKKNPPYLTEEGANWLINHGVSFIGIDTLLIDDYMSIEELGNPVHQIILGSGSIICEDMKNLDLVPQKGAILSAVPPRIAMSSFPVRVYAKILQ